MLRNWRVWVLLILLLGPILAYMGFGFLWLAKQPSPFGILPGEWVYVAAAVWIAAGAAFAVLMNRWTRSKRALMPPLDWDAPGTFSPADLDAWKIVEEEAGRAESIEMEALTKFDTYIDTGRRLARRLATHYRPRSRDPIDHVPVVEILTALQLAAEDLGGLCREVPGGDMVTPNHWKTAVQAAGYIQKANDIYSILLPIFSPVTGLMRLGTQRLMVRPAWKNMQQNLMRWFFQAYLNRLGMHLIELYSGRLSIGADQYRKLTRRAGRSATVEEPRILSIALAGTRGVEMSRLIALLDRERAGDSLQDGETTGGRRLRRAPGGTAEVRSLDRGLRVHGEP